MEFINVTGFENDGFKEWIWSNVFPIAYDVPFKNQATLIRKKMVKSQLDLVLAQKATTEQMLVKSYFELFWKHKQYLGT